jgi:serine/threonine-protein kinase SRK2
MGTCCSSSDDKYEVKQPERQPSTKAAPPAGGTGSRRSSQPDFGLVTTHEVIKLLGRGGEGETWLCKEKDTGHEVAIKLIKRPIPKPAVEVIKREILIQAKLGQGHLNIVSADEVLMTKTHLGLVMEYVPGG